MQANPGNLFPLILFGVFWLAVGYLVFNWMERRARQVGTIGHF